MKIRLTAYHASTGQVRHFLKLDKLIFSCISWFYDYSFRTGVFVIIGRCDRFALGLESGIRTLVTLDTRMEPRDLELYFHSNPVERQAPDHHCLSSTCIQYMWPIKYVSEARWRTAAIIMLWACGRGSIGVKCCVDCLLIPEVLTPSLLYLISHFQNSTDIWGVDCVPWLIPGESLYIYILC